MATSQFRLLMDPDVIADFRDSFQEHYNAIANGITQLETNPENFDTVNEVFRSLHTIKGNASMCQMHDLIHFTHALEDVVGALRQNKLKYIPLLGEVILLVLDKTKEVSEDIFAGRSIDKDKLDRTTEVLHKLAQAEQNAAPVFAEKIITHLTGHVFEPHSIPLENTPIAPQIEHDQTPNTAVPIASYPLVETSEDGDMDENQRVALAYFEHLAGVLDRKFNFWQNRVQRTLPLALALNKALGIVEAPAQLRAAVYLHDVALAFLSDELLLKSAKYDQTDIDQMGMHPKLGADFLALIPGWETAAAMILQHHEHWDGSGYPNGIAGEQIRLGAQILAITDAYESITQPRPDRQHKRSVLRAVTEINNHSGTQFSPKLVSQFIVTLRELHNNN